MSPQRPRLPLDDLQPSVSLRKRVEFANHKRMGRAEHAREGSAVMGNIALGGNDQRRLQGCQPVIFRLEFRDQGKKPFGFIRLFAHAASRLRNDTITDFEVGVSLSSPALPSGTRTLSSG